MARRELCTYLDLQYLDKGIALFDSLREAPGDFHLRVVCFDDLSYRRRSRARRPAARGGPRRRARARRSRAARDPHPALPGGVHVDRDALRDPLLPRPRRARRDHLHRRGYAASTPRPSPRSTRSGDGSVLITPASSSPQHYSRGLVRRTGLYVVQFMTFRSDEDGRAALEWWRERCIEWCFARYEDGQDGRPEVPRRLAARGSEAFASSAIPACSGPGASSRARSREGEDGVTVDGEPLIFFHFMGLRRYADGTYRPAAGRFRITTEQRRWIYDPYVERLAELRAARSRRSPRTTRSAIEQHEPLRWRLQTPVSR